MPSLPTKLPRHETLVIAVLYLMTKHAQSPCPIVGRAVADHLDLLARYPVDKCRPDSFDLSRRLAATWSLLAAESPGRFIETDWFSATSLQ